MGFSISTSPSLVTHTLSADEAKASVVALALAGFRLDKRGWTKIVTTSATFAMQSSAESKVPRLPLSSLD